MKHERILTRAEQRAFIARRVMLSLGVEAQLMLLIDDILVGDKSKLTEFQQLIQYAPLQMKDRLRTRLR